MKMNLTRIAALGLIVIILCSVVALAQKKKKRKKVPIPKSRAEVVTMSGGSTHDVEWSRTKNGQGTLIATGDNPPNESYKSPQNTLANGNPASGASNAGTNTRSRSTNVGSNSVKQVPRTPRSFLSVGKPTNYALFEFEIKCAIEGEANCRLANSNPRELKLARNIFQEMKRQLAAGRKVTVDDGTPVRPENLDLRLYYKEKKATRTTTDLSTGRQTSKTREWPDSPMESAQFYLREVDQNHYFQSSIQSPLSDYEACQNVLTKAGTATFSAHCEEEGQGDFGRHVRTTIITLEFSESAIHVRTESKDAQTIRNGLLGTLDVTETDYQFEQGTFLLLWQ